jgi:hypothetical protein
LQEREHLPPSRVQGPLPDESTFVVQAREAMPAPRTTTAQTRSGLVARGRTRTTTTTAQASAEGSSRGRRRGRAKGKKRQLKMEEANLLEEGVDALQRGKQAL